MRRLLTLATLVLATSVVGCGDSSDSPGGSGGTTFPGGSGGDPGGSGGTDAGGSGGTGGSGGEMGGSGGETGGSGGEMGGAGGETGGSGGEMGGSGGTMLDPPEIASFAPTLGTVGTQVNIKGENFGTDKAKLQVKFDGVPAAIDRVIDGVEIVTKVPGGAGTGPITVIRDGVSVDTGRKYFTVSRDNPTPVLTELSPPVATAGSPGIPVVLMGSNFTNTSRVLLDGEELDSDYDTPEAMRANIPAVKLEVARDYDLWVENSEPPTPAPRSQKIKFRVVPPMRVLRALATGPKSIRVEFDQDVDPADAADHNLFTAQEPFSSLAISKSERDATHASWVNLTSNSTQSANADYTLTVKTSVRSALGGKLDPDRNRDVFWAYGSTPKADGVYGQNTGCSPLDMSTPYGISSYGDKLYVMETDGQQVQVVGLDGSFLGFYGMVGGVSGYYTKAASKADGCLTGGSADDGAFADPRGGVAVGANGQVIAADPEYDRVYLFKAAGAFDKLVGNGWLRPVVLGVYGGKAVIADGTDAVRFFDFAAKEDDTLSFSSGSGTGDGEFSFGTLVPSRLPGMAVRGTTVYLCEPANHRVQRLEDEVATGWIGVGHTDGFATGGSCCDSGTGNSEFTNPKGVAVDAAGQIFVVDDGALPSKGRLQKFDPTGKYHSSLSFDFAVGGVTVDQEGYLWIVDDTNSRLRRYKP